MTLLILSIITLVVAPTVAAMVPRESPTFRAIDGYILITVGGLALLELLPNAVNSLGWIALLAALFGLMIPTYLESRIHARTAHRGVIAFVLLGLALHAAMDGAALGISEVQHGDGHHGGGHTLELMSLGVILHRIPLGLLLWWVVRPLYGIRGVGVVIGLVCGATIVGYVSGDTIFDGLPPEGLALFVAVVAGALLHVLLHSFHPLDDHASDDAHDGTDACCGDDAARDEEVHDHGHHVHHRDHGTSQPMEHENAHAHAHEHDHHHDHAHAHDHDHGAHHDHAHAHGHHHHHGHDYSHIHDHHTGHHWAEVVGAMLGAATLLALRHSHPDFAVPGGELSATTTLYTLALESAPALVLAYIGAGLLRAFITPGTLSWLGKGGHFSQSLRGVSFGLPLPVCSCGVLPLYESLTVAGAPTAAAVAFLIATPELGLDAVLLSLPLLGVEMTLMRIVVAALIALLAGVIAVRVFRRRPSMGGSNLTGLSGPMRERLKSGLRYGFVDVVDHTIPWIIVGIAVAALLEPMLSLDQLTVIPDAVQVPLFAILGIPLYVCAAGATPLVAVLMHKGLSAGAAIAFLMTGPATNITTFGVLGRLHGRRAAWVFGGVVGFAAILGGYGANLFSDLITLPELHDAAHTDAYPLQLLSLFVLGIMTLASLGRQGLRGMLSQITGEHHH